MRHKQLHRPHSITQAARLHNERRRDCITCPIKFSCSVDIASVCVATYKKGFVTGYKNAQLSCDDIKIIVRIADEMFHEYSHDELVAMGQQSYYSEVLKRYKREKENERKGNDSKE